MGRGATSLMGDSCVAANGALLDHIVGGKQQGCWHLDADRFCGLQIDNCLGLHRVGAQ